MSPFVLYLFFGFSSAYAVLVPTAPGPGDSFAAGSTCLIKWNADPTDSWAKFSIDLMSGSNDAMRLVTNVASGVDGTDSSLSPYNWTCPQVSPYSSIYFYQFNNSGNSTDRQWTTRFAIASSSGESTPPENPTQPNGDPIPWGSGQLVSARGSQSQGSSSDPSSSLIAAEAVPGPSNSSIFTVAPTHTTLEVVPTIPPPQDAQTHRQKSLHTQSVLNPQSESKSTRTRHAVKTSHSVMKGDRISSTSSARRSDKTHSTSVIRGDAEATPAHQFRPPQPAPDSRMPGVSDGSLHIANGSGKNGRELHFGRQAIWVAAWALVAQVVL